jgi:hypothetical protein
VKLWSVFFEHYFFQNLWKAVSTSPPSSWKILSYIAITICISTSLAFLFHPHTIVEFHEVEYLSLLVVFIKSPLYNPSPDSISIVVSCKTKKIIDVQEIIDKILIQTYRSLSQPRSFSLKANVIASCNVKNP